MRPVIGVPLRYQHLEDGRPILYLGEIVRKTLIEAGAIVFSIAPVEDIIYIDTKGNEFKELSELEKSIIDKNLNLCDGLFLPGGIKITPYDRYLLEQAIKKNIPILGVCLGMQMMSCYQKDIELLKNETSINHKQENDEILSHKVKIDKNSKLYKIIGEEEFMVNSFHKYHGTPNKTLYKSVGFSEDNILEAIESKDNNFNIGLQWHPEISYNFDNNSKKVINAFIESSRDYMLKKDKNKNSLKISA